LLKITHEKELMECRFQIRSLMDGNSTAEYRRDHLEKTTEDLKAVVCSLSLALEKLRETHENEVVERLQSMGEFRKLRASAERWADEEKRLSRGWEEARSALERVKSELTCALSMHEQVTAELKDSRETVVRVNLQLKDVQATKEELLDNLEEARSKVTQLNKELAASRKSQEGLASKLSSQSHENTLDLKAAQKALADTHLELENVKSELTSCKRQNTQMESQFSKTKSELAAASSNFSLLQKAESDLALAKVDLLAARKKLAQGKHLLPFFDASPNLKLPVESVPLSFPIQPYRFVKNVVVRMASDSQVGILTYIL
jgi:chromosome segregation ATPase